MRQNYLRSTFDSFTQNAVIRLILGMGIEGVLVCVIAILHWRSTPGKGRHTPDEGFSNIAYRWLCLMVAFAVLPAPNVPPVK